MATAYVEIPLSGKNAAGRAALIDTDDYAAVIGFHWRAAYGKYPYVVVDVGPRRIYMHQLITGFPKTDHADSNELNNRKTNLRDGAAGKNEYNQRAQTGRSSQYKGVWLYRSNGWRAAIQQHGKRHHLGVFSTEEAAAHAYDDAALERFGEYAKLNFPS
jgi:hypothetical protein